MMTLLTINVFAAVALCFDCDVVLHEPVPFTLGLLENCQDPTSVFRTETLTLTFNPRAVVMTRTHAVGQGQRLRSWFKS